MNEFFMDVCAAGMVLIIIAIVFAVIVRFWKFLVNGDEDV